MWVIPGQPHRKHMCEYYTHYCNEIICEYCTHRCNEIMYEYCTRHCNVAQPDYGCFEELTLRAMSQECHHMTKSALQYQVVYSVVRLPLKRIYVLSPWFTCRMRLSLLKLPIGNVCIQDQMILWYFLNIFILYIGFIIDFTMYDDTLYIYTKYVLL